MTFFSSHRNSHTKRQGLNPTPSSSPPSHLVSTTLAVRLSRTGVISSLPAGAYGNVTGRWWTWWLCTHTPLLPRGELSAVEHEADLFGIDCIDLYAVIKEQTRFQCVQKSLFVDRRPEVSVLIMNNVKHLIFFSFLAAYFLTESPTFPTQLDLKVRKVALRKISCTQLWQHQKQTLIWYLYQGKTSKFRSTV